MHGGGWEGEWGLWVWAALGIVLLDITWGLVFGDSSGFCW